MRLRWPGRRRPSQEQPREPEDPPPYPHNEEEVDSHIISGINTFISTAKGSTTRIHWKLELLMYPTPEYCLANPNAYDTPPWVARVIVLANNLPRLMLKGLHVGEDNLIRTKGHFVLDEGDTTRSSGLPPRHVRKYFLAEPNEQWTARVTVHSPAVSELTKLKVRCMSPAYHRRPVANLSCYS